MLYERCVDCVHKKILTNNKDLEKIFRKSLEAINTRTIIHEAAQLTDNNLKLKDRHYKLDKKCYVVGFGKAVFNMAIELESILGPNLAAGICSIPTGYLDTEERRRMAARSQIKFQQGAKNNLPDAAAESTAREILNLIKPLEKGDLLIVLISGGGSALLPLPKAPVSLDEKIEIVKQLSKNGANIIELNSVRKRLSVLKGGGLAREAYPANVVALILSDVIGDPLDFISSGPTVPNEDPPEAALNIINNYGFKAISPAVKSVLKSEMEDASCDIVRTPLGTYIHVENYIIGSNRLVAEAAKADAIRRGYQAAILSLQVEGEVSDISIVYATLCTEVAELMKEFSSLDYLYYKLGTIKQRLKMSQESVDEILSLDFKADKGICFIAAGEPTLKVWGKGKGGRNQHLALQFSVDVSALVDELENISNMNISLLSCGTDGIDGPTDAAGAIGTTDLYAMAIAKEMSPERYLRNFDSYNFFSDFMDGKYMIKTGHTGTNVMDLHMMIINKGYVFENNEDISRLELIEFSKSFHC